MKNTRCAGRPFEFPDPNDRSPNEPHAKLERQEILGLYNQAAPENNAQKVSEAVKKWVEEEATSLGWSTVNFIESTAILGADVVLKTPSN